MKQGDRRSSVIDQFSECVDISTGVLQGDVLVPFLFILVMDYSLTRSEGQHGFVYRTLREPRKPARRINDLEFADDIVLLENAVFEKILKHYAPPVNYIIVHINRQLFT